MSSLRGTVQNEKKEIDKEKVSFRPSAYGLIVKDGKVLMTVVKTTGRFMPPGGGVEIGETLEQAVKREVQEECGIQVNVGRQLFFAERFFFYEPLNSAWQCHLFFFLATPTSFILSDMGNDKDDESIQPQWVDLVSLKESDFQVCGDLIMESLNNQ